MSQASGQSAGAGGSPKGSATAGSAGRGVLFLAIFVVLTVGLLHALDKPQETNLTAAVSTPVKKEEAITPVTTAVPTTLAPARSPADVKVLVTNGTGTSGVAAKVAGRLQPIGYQLLKPNNTVNKETVSLVQFVTGYEAEAQAVATSLGIASTSVVPLPTPSPVTDLQGANVLVIVGDELAASAQGTTPTGVATTTTISQALTGPLTATTIAPIPTTTVLR